MTGITDLTRARTADLYWPSHVRGTVRLMDVIADARRQGFEVEERVIGDAWVWGWCRGDDDRWPCFHERRQAVSWMRDRLKRTAVFK